MNTDSKQSGKRAPSRWKRWVKRLLFAGAALLTLLFLILAVENYRARRAWDSYREKLEAQGEKFEIEAHRPPAVPDEQNFAAIPLFQDLNNTTNRPPDGRRESLFPWTWPRGDWAKAQLTEWSRWQQEIRQGPDELQTYGLPQRPPSDEVLGPRETAAGDPVDDLFFLLDSRKEIMDQVRQAASRPYTRFDLDLVLADANLSIISRTKELAGAFQAKALAELSRDNPNTALVDWRMMLRLADAVGSEPLLIFHLVEIAILGASIQPVWEGLALQQWTENELIEIEQALTRINLSADLARTFRGERLFNLLGLDALPDRPNQDSSLTPVKSWLFAASHYRNRLNITRMYQENFLPPLDPENRDFDLAQIQALEAETEERFRRKTPYNVMAAMLYPAITKTSYKSLRMQATVEIARTACAVERWRIAHGRYPNELEDLVPQFLSEVPIDLCDDKPLKYRLLQDGRFILYSIGIDGEDDSGKIRDELDRRDPDRELGDWVWKYPGSR